MIKKPALSAVIERIFFSIFFANGEVAAELVITYHSKVWWIDKVWVEHTVRKQGLALKILEAAVIAHQDKDLYINIQPFEGQPVNEECLANLYSKVGFFELGGKAPGMMHRPPGLYEKKV